MRKTLGERLAEGETIPVSKTELEELNMFTPSVTLEFKMNELHKLGVVGIGPGSYADSTRWTYEGRNVHFVRNFTGVSEWKNVPEGGLSEQHDLAVDLETKTVLASAKS